MSEERRVAPADGYSAPAIGTAVAPVPSDDVPIDEEFRDLSPAIQKKYRILRQMATTPRTTFSSRPAVTSVKPDIEGAERDADALIDDVFDVITQRLLLSNGTDEDLKARLAEQQARLAEKDARLAEKDARIVRLEKGLRLLKVSFPQNPASSARVHQDSDEDGEEDACGGDQLFEPDSGSDEENQDQGLLSGVGSSSWLSAASPDTRPSPASKKTDASRMSAAVFDTELVKLAAQRVWVYGTRTGQQPLLLDKANVVLHSLGIDDPGKELLAMTSDGTAPPELSGGSEDDAEMVRAYVDMLEEQNSLEYKSQFATASLAFSIGQAKQNLQGRSGGRAKQNLEWAEKVMHERAGVDRDYP